jgi:hypothetical protein
MEEAGGEVKNEELEREVIDLRDRLAGKELEVSNMAKSLFELQQERVNLQTDLRYAIYS